MTAPCLTGALLLSSNPSAWSTAADKNTEKCYGRLVVSINWNCFNKILTPADIIRKNQQSVLAQKKCINAQFLVQVSTFSFLICPTTQINHKMLNHWYIEGQSYERFVKQGFPDIANKVCSFIVLRLLKKTVLGTDLDDIFPNIANA